jgi:hypothetical protein
MKFEKNISQLLSYDRERYFDFFDDDISDLDLTIYWHGISLQLEDIRNEELYLVSGETVNHAINVLEAGFREIVSKLDHGLSWDNKP